MTAGIPHGWETFFSDEDFKKFSAAELVRTRGVIVLPPGEFYLYSNFAYGVLEAVIEKVSGKSYGEFVRSELFGPHGCWLS